MKSQRKAVLNGTGRSSNPTLETVEFGWHKPLVFQGFASAQKGLPDVAGRGPIGYNETFKVGYLLRPPFVGVAGYPLDEGSRL
jgi:hypothetical protein